jgi:hypothetical protein
MQVIPVHSTCIEFAAQRAVSCVAVVANSDFWSFQLLVETLPPLMRLLILRGTDPAEMTMASRGIVEVLDVLG